MKINALLISLFLIIAGCSPKLSELIMNLQESDNAAYGYTSVNPIRIGYYSDTNKNIEATYYYLSHLKTYDNRRLKFITRYSIKDPISKPEKSILPLRNGINVRGGILDCYEYLDVEAGDTVRLYFDIYHYDSLRVPQKLIFINN